MVAEQNEQTVLQVRELRWIGQNCHMQVEESRLNGNIPGRMGVWERPVAVSHICKAGSATLVIEEHMLLPRCAVCVWCLEVLKVG